jgi:hypothetical protein
MTDGRCAVVSIWPAVCLIVGCSSPQPIVLRPRPTPQHFAVRHAVEPSPPPRTVQLPDPPEFRRTTPTPVPPVRPTPTPETPKTATPRYHEPAWLPSPAAELKRRKDEGPWKFVVIHHSDSERGGAEAIDKYHREVRRWSGGLGYDFVIGNGSLTADGKVEVGGRWLRQEDGAHAGVEEYNRFGIGICLVGDFTRHAPSPAQMQSLARLVNFLCERYQIPRDRKHIIGHGEVRNTQCPGPKFAWADLMQRIRQ